MNGGEGHFRMLQALISPWMFKISVISFFKVLRFPFVGHIITVSHYEEARIIQSRIPFSLRVSSWGMKLNEEQDPSDQVLCV
jgi:hypothetical protein